MLFANFSLNCQHNCCVFRPPNPFRIKYTWLKTNITFILQAISDNMETNRSYAIEYFTKPTISLHFIFVQR